MLLFNYIKDINCTNTELQTQTNSSMLQFPVLKINNFSVVRSDAIILCTFAFMAQFPLLHFLLSYQAHHSSHPSSFFLPCFY